MSKQKLAKNEFDTIADSLSEKVRINRLKKLYSIDEILDVLGWGDGSMDAADSDKIEATIPESKEWYSVIYGLAVNNGNFIQAIAMNKYLPI